MKIASVFGDRVRAVDAVEAVDPGDETIGPIVGVEAVKVFHLVKRTVARGVVDPGEGDLPLSVFEGLRDLRFKLSMLVPGGADIPDPADEIQGSRMQQARIRK